MDKRTDIAMIGDRDSVLIGKAVGLGVFDETDGERETGLYTGLPGMAARSFS